MANPYAKCQNCGKRHRPDKKVHFTGAICDMQEEQPKRVRVRCPFHDHLCYGTRRFYYDTVRTFLDCGTFLDHGYQEWRLPEGVSRRRWQQIRRERKAKVA